ncbi:carboxylesterase family protein [Rhodoplanes sp. TEM]|uniref:Carboxylic ester hydrolase n=1 Tax=Rhodoplanes tepidamans TaxID=200616 RepID=A0ABT5J4C6_RHOTP|nr:MULTISPECIES: carboxylesterase family protein [Rhodoplanes]MDC7784494.1 carboxylesterase family protein [Rhodoplanes tepidamans]MDC7983524.1 carboxylesterase family protein [Rhodoplanes sp. TEM]MDQ0357002.1 para-nitrobenzyl esterase [Rhodoplanes tepidamans]
MSKPAFARRAIPARVVLWLAAAVATSLPAVAAEEPAGTAAEGPVVATDTGKVRGTAGDGVSEFRGIPYAEPPVGLLRFAPPRQALPWRGVRDATRYGHACPQVSRYGLTEASDTEDCLTLNITVPTGDAAAGEAPAGGRKPGRKAARKPVIVWIHGGAFVGGSSALYPLAPMAKAGDVVVVSLNYRLGVFGFMPHPAFPASHNGGFGLEDQRLAMRWVKRNIAAFGGDPDNITVAGESAGASSVCMHLIAPKETAGLFRRAIVQSGGCAHPLRPVAEAAAAVGAQVAEKVGCGDKATALSCLRRAKVTDLLAAAAAVGASDLMAFSPVYGTLTVPLQSQEALRTGRFVKVPVLNGGDAEELRLYVAYDVQAGARITAETYPDDLEAVYGDTTPAVLKEYPVTAYSSAPTALGSVMSDFSPKVGLNNCIYLEAGKLMRKHVPVYEYVFGDPAAPPVTTDPGFEMGAVHSSELPYQFPRFDNTTKVAGPDLAPDSQKLAEQMTAYWTSFARTGVPVAAGAPVWPRYTKETAVMNFTPGQVGTFDASVAHKCGFWKPLYPGFLTQ